ncbi:MAG: hypothetical protein AB7E59_03045 [Pusillimonas sp.]
MNKASVHEPSLFKFIILITCIVVAMFGATVLVALVFMPGPLIARLPFEDVTFLLPLALSTLCSASVLGWYVQSHRSRSKSNEKH